MERCNAADQVTVQKRRVRRRRKKAARKQGTGHDSETATTDTQQTIAETGKPPVANHDVQPEGEDCAATPAQTKQATQEQSTTDVHEEETDAPDSEAANEKSQATEEQSSTTMEHTKDSAIPNDVEDDWIEEEEEEEVEPEDVTMEERLDVAKYFKKGFLHSASVRAITTALRTYRSNSEELNHVIAKLIHRIAYENHNEVMLFQLSLLRVLEHIINDKDLRMRVKEV